MSDNTLLDLSRWQWALTAAFHITFPAVTVGTSVFLVVCHAMYMRSDDEVWLRMFRFWRRIFGIGFALGVVSGIMLTFEFGLNWGRFAHDVGPIVGVIIAMEVVTASFGIRFVHMLVGALIAAAWFIAGVSAWYLLKRRHLAIARRGVSVTLDVLALLVPVQMFIGDHDLGGERHRYGCEGMADRLVRSNWDRYPRVASPRRAAARRATHRDPIRVCLIRAA